MEFHYGILLAWLLPSSVILPRFSPFFPARRGAETRLAGCSVVQNCSSRSLFAFGSLIFGFPFINCISTLIPSPGPSTELLTQSALPSVHRVQHAASHDQFADQHACSILQCGATAGPHLGRQTNQQTFYTPSLVCSTRPETDEVI